MRLMERMERCSSKFSRASWPKARVPSRRSVTTEGVHFCPSWLDTTSAWPNWKLATTELLVPKSMPMYGTGSPLDCGGHWPGSNGLGVSSGPFVPLYPVVNVLTTAPGSPGSFRDVDLRAAQDKLRL